MKCTITYNELREMTDNILDLNRVWNTPTFSHVSELDAYKAVVSTIESGLKFKVDAESILEMVMERITANARFTYEREMNREDG